MLTGGPLRPHRPSNVSLQTWLRASSLPLPVRGLLQLSPEGPASSSLAQPCAQAWHAPSPALSSPASTVLLPHVSQHEHPSRGEAQPSSPEQHAQAPSSRELA